MDGLMMDFQLTLDAVLRRAEQHFFKKEIVTRLPDKSFHRYSYRDMAQRAKKLALALQRLGIQPGDAVGTRCWNHSHHCAASFGIPLRAGSEATDKASKATRAARGTRMVMSRIWVPTARIGK